jgi:hypothetical protein
MKLNKIPLAQFISILEEIYDSGAKYVDIEGYPDSNGGELKDIIKLIIRPEYLMDDDEKEEVNDVDVKYEENKDDKLSDEDISDLI